MGKTKKNILFQLAYQILAVILPLITTPVVTRGLGADSLGQYSYTYAIVLYFATFALLGVNSYGTREVAKAQGSGNQKNVDRVFSEIYTLQLVLSIVVIILYYLYVFLFQSKYRLISLIQGIYLIGTLTDVAWFYFGIEEFKTTVTRNMIVKSLCAVVILAFIRSPEDLLLYTITLIGSNAISNVILAINLKKYVHFNMPSFDRVIIHLKPNLVLFVPVVAASIYYYIDKIMLGAISGTVQSGYYDVIEKIVNIPNACVVAIANVLFPKISALLASGNKEDNKQIFKYITLSICLVNCFSMGCFFGFKSVAYLFIPLFLGDGFAPAVDMIIWGSAILIPKGIRVLIKQECLLPYEKDKEVNAAIISGALSNLIINMMLIPKYGAIGAIIATFICETISCIVMMFFARHHYNSFKYMILSLPFVVFAVLMSALIDVMKQQWALDGIVGLGVYSVLGAAFYCALSFVYLFFARRKNII